ncbi:MAG TPA: hypothetical protein VJH92_04245 [Candidatus Nanoarchaeia archaeon]|nr:hypothetical protein [Candidatus Nanoarchaeia archaeon]
MTIRDLSGKVEDLIRVKNVIISVYHKEGLDMLAVGLIEENPDVRFISSGGTYTALNKILGSSGEERLIEASSYTGFPEMDGGLVKTLHPKIHGGILGERNNPKHQQYLSDLNGGVYIDLVVVDLYPFGSVVKKIERGEINPQTGNPFNFESARGNIDIGGPAMLRAGAKNFPSCAAISSVYDYSQFLFDLRKNKGNTDFKQRFNLAKKVFTTTSEYDSAIAVYLSAQDPNEVKDSYEFSEK